jgi:hypothetical protein
VARLEQNSAQTVPAQPGRSVHCGYRKADAFGPPKEEMEEWLSHFRMKVVDVNRTSRGSPTGGIGRFSALVVVGNSNVRSFCFHSTSSGSDLITLSSIIRLSSNLQWAKLI